jgi:hypothetical protein
MDIHQYKRLRKQFFYLAAAFVPVMFGCGRSMQISVRDVLACDCDRGRVVGCVNRDVGPSPQLVLPILRRVNRLVAAFGCEVSALRVSETKITGYGDYGQITVKTSRLHSLTWVVGVIAFSSTIV